MTEHKYRKKPVEIEAFQLKTKDLSNAPKWLIEASETAYNCVGALIDFNVPGKFFGINSLEGMMFVSPGDWIIKGINNELYPCKPDIFEKTYDKV